MNKKKIGIVIVLVFVLAAGSIYFSFSNEETQNDEKQVEISQEEDMYCSIFGASYMEDGILYVDGDEYGSLIRFCDNSSGLDGVICMDKTCEHSTRMDSTCSAHISGGNCGLAVRGEWLYFFSMDEEKEGVCYIYRSDLDGKNREKLYQVEDVDLLMDVIYHKNLIFYSYCKFDANDDERRVVRICKYDMETKEEELIYELDSTQVMIQGMTLKENVIYLSVVYSDATKEEVLKHKFDENFEKKHQQCKIIGIDFESREELFMVNGTASNRVLSVVQNKLLCKSYDGMDIYCYDVDTMKKEIFKNRNYIPIQSDSNVYAYFLEYKEKNGKENYIYYQYNPKENEWKTLGESSTYYYSLTNGNAYGEIGNGEEAEKVRLSEKEFLQGTLKNESKYERIN